jgi:hypothetical protein
MALFEIVCESEGHNGEAGIIVGTGISLQVWRLAFFVVEFSFLSMNGAHLVKELASWFLADLEMHYLRTETNRSIQVRG